MSPDLFFLFTLLAKMAVAGLFVISATIAAERAGPFVGALVVTLPVSAGPAYVFLALDHDAAFISASALASLANNIVTFAFALAFIFISQRFRTLTSVALSLVCWAGATVVVRQFQWTAPTATLGNIAAFFVCYALARRYADAPMPRVELRFTDVLLRALLVAALVALVVGLSFAIGPSATGVLAAYPVVYTSIMLNLHRRVGAAATAAVLAHGFAGLLGFGFALLVLHVSAVSVGTIAALSLALAFSVVWNSALFATRHLAAA